MNLTMKAVITICINIIYLLNIKYYMLQSSQLKDVVTVGKDVFLLLGGNNSSPPPQYKGNSYDCC